MLSLDDQHNGIIACTISRDLSLFEMVIDDMEATLDESWGDFTLIDGVDVISRPEASKLEFIVLTIDEQDQNDLVLITQIIVGAQEQGIEVILVTVISDMAFLNQLTALGVSHYVPYPISQNGLRKVINHIRQDRAAKKPPLKPQPPAPHEDMPMADGEEESNDDADGAKTVDRPSTTHQDEDIGGGGIVIPIHGLAGGTGATTLAVELASELSTIMGEDSPVVCLLDFDVQYGGIARNLGLERGRYVSELIGGADVAGNEEFAQSLTKYSDRLFVLTAPVDMLLLDTISPASISALIAMAEARFDYIIIDMPKTLTLWTETVLQLSDIYLGVAELDTRCVYNIERFHHELQAESQSDEKIHYVLNRAPKSSDFTANTRAESIEKELGISFDVRLPDGGSEVAEAQDATVPIMHFAPQNALRKEVQNLAAAIHDMSKPQK